VPSDLLLTPGAEIGLGCHRQKTRWTSGGGGSKPPGEIDQLNGIDVKELRDYVASAERDSAVAERNPVVVARWVGGDQAEVVATTGGPAVVATW
jgi:hypothetical protein